MRKDGLIHAQSRFPPSMTLITAMILLVIGLVAIVSMISSGRAVRLKHESLRG